MPLTLAAGEQRILPDAISFLRAGRPRDSGRRLERRGLAPGEGAARRHYSSGVLVAGARTYTGSTLRPGTFGVYYRD